jgi:hypothetical protein
MSIGGCGQATCLCGIESESLSIIRIGNTFIIEQVEIEDITALEATVANLAAVINDLASVYVAKPGDEMSGTLVLNGTSASARFMRDSDNPYIEWVKQDGDRIGFILASSGGLDLRMNANAGYDLTFVTDDTEERMRIKRSSGIILIGKTATDIAETGVEFQPNGIVYSTQDATGNPNYRSNKTGAADVNGATHMRIDSAGTEIGSITRASSISTGFNTSSDEDLKQGFEAISDELALYWLRVVQPMLYEHIAEPGVTQVGYVAQRVAAAWPESITLGIVRPGHGDITKRTWDADGNETTSDEVWRSWQIDYSKFSPLVHASVRAVDARVLVLEQIALEQSQRIDVLEDRLADVEDDLAGLQAAVIGLSQHG